LLAGTCHPPHPLHKCRRIETDLSRASQRHVR
jgi:hypothetical protein